MDVREDQDTECPSNDHASACASSRGRRVVLRLRGERGVGLVELLAVIPMSAVVLLGMYALYNVGVKSQSETNNRVRSLMQQQQGMERIAREMRQATSITPVSSQVLDGVTWVRPADGTASILRRVRYDCSIGEQCRRWEGPSGGSLDAGSVTVVSDVLNADVFQLEPNSVDPTRVVTRVEVRVRGANNPLVLDGGFAFRNLNGDS